MKAIVLTCDRYRPVTEHMIFKYGQLWPIHPFHFCVPYQFLPCQESDQILFIKSCASIKATVLAMLDGLDEEEWIYWCIDDKYPVQLNLPKIATVIQWLTDPRTLGVSGVLFCRCRGMLEDRNLTGARVIDDSGNIYLERKAYEQIWIHQFLRVKVIRHLFKSFPDVIPYASIMDSFKSEVVKPSTHRLYVTEQNLAVFGESTLKGILTQNCYESIVENGLFLPVALAASIERKVILGKI